MRLKNLIAVVCFAAVSPAMACFYGTYGFHRDEKEQTTVKALLNESYTEEQNRDAYWYKSELDRLKSRLTGKSQDLNFLEDYAFLLYRTGKNADSEKVYRQILAKEPERFSAVAGLGTMMHNMHRYDEAAALLGKAARLRPDFRNGAEKLHLRMIEFEKQQRSSPGYGNKHMFLDELTPIWDKRKTPKEGFGDAKFPDIEEDAVAELLRQYPKFGDGWFVLGMILQHDGDHPRALRAYELAVKLASSHRQEIGEHVKQYADYARSQDPARTGARRILYLVIFFVLLVVILYVGNLIRKVILDITAARAEKEAAEKRAAAKAQKRDGVL